MSGQLTDTKKRLALDTDWLTAAGMVALFLMSLCLGAGTIWITVRGTLTVSGVSWTTVLLAAAFLYFGFAVYERLFKIAAFLLASGPVSRIALSLLHASGETRRMNTIFTSWIDALVYLAVSVYVICWFRSKLTHV
jgi:hypothetical protein